MFKKVKRVGKDEATGEGSITLPAIGSCCSTGNLLLSSLWQLGVLSAHSVELSTASVGRITTLLIQKRNLEIFEYRIEANGSSYIKYWRINKRVAADIKNLVVINSDYNSHGFLFYCINTPIYQWGECGRCDRCLCKQAIFRKNAAKASAPSLLLSAEKWVSVTNFFTYTGKCHRFFILEALINLIDLITEHLKNGRRMLHKSLCNEIEKQKPYIADTYPHWKHDVRSTLKESGRFEIKNDRAWSIKESRIEDITPRLTVGTEKFPIPPSTIIQTHLPPPLISRGYVPIASAMEPQADQQPTSKMTSLSVLQSEKNLALWTVL
jgi:hypothetical protein